MTKAIKTDWGIGVPSLLALQAIKSLGENATGKEIIFRTGWSETVVNNIVSRLRSKGLIASERSVFAHYWLTDDGEETLASIKKALA